MALGFDLVVGNPPVLALLFVAIAILLFNTLLKFWSRRES